MLSHFTRTRKSTPTPLVHSGVVKHESDLPATLYADLIESGTTNDIDIFLTRVT